MGRHTRLGGFLDVMRRLITRSWLLKRMARMMPHARKAKPFLVYLVVVGRKPG